MASPKEGATKTQNGQKYVYKNGQWRSARFRTPANDLIEGTGNAARNTTQRTAAATSTAAARTAEREKKANQQAIGLRGRNQKPEAKPASKPTPSPASKPKPKVADYTDAQGNTYDGNSGGLKSAAKPKPSPKPSTSPASTPAPAARSTTPKPAEKISSSAPQSDAGMKNQNKDYRGNLFEKTFGYKKGDAPDQRARNERVAEAESQANKARVKQGPAAPAKPASPPSPNQPKKNDKGTKVMTLAERMRRRRMSLD